MQGIMVWRVVKALFGLLLLGALVLGVFLWSETNDTLTSFVGENPVTTMLGVFVLSALSVILAPFSAIVIVPIASGFMNPALIGISAWLGWSIGAWGAFSIARIYGQQILTRFISLRRIYKYEFLFERSERAVLLSLLHIVIPPEVAGYGLGLISRVSFRMYFLTSLIGIFPFAFAFSYGGAFLSERSFSSLSILTLVFGLLYIVVFFYLFKKRHGVRR